MKKLSNDILKFPLLLFSDTESRERFLTLDVRVLEAEASVAIPPPGWLPPAAAPAEPVVRLWHCGIGACDAAFETRKGLVVHKVHSNLPGHGIRILANVITVNNQCLLCNRFFCFYHNSEAAHKKKHGATRNLSHTW